jgi:hypothetical protein
MKHIKKYTDFVNESVHSINEGMEDRLMSMLLSAGKFTAKVLIEYFYNHPEELEEVFKGVEDKKKKEE